MICSTCIICHTRKTDIVVLIRNNLSSIVLDTGLRQYSVFEINNMYIFDIQKKICKYQNLHKGILFKYYYISICCNTYRVMTFVVMNWRMLD